MLSLGAKISGRMELKDGFTISGDVLGEPFYTIKGQD